MAGICRLLIFNRPLTYVDPSEFAPGNGRIEQAGRSDIPLPNDQITAGPDWRLTRELLLMVKPQFWKREAATNPEKYSPKDLELMKSGKAPYGPDGRRLELHHIQPLSEGGTNDPENLRIMTRTEHRIGPNFKINHPR